MSPPTEKTVAAISFHDNKSLSIDIENVFGIDIGTPQQMAENIWFVDIIVRSDLGNVSLQMTADSMDKLKPTQGKEVG